MVFGFGWVLKETKMTPSGVDANTLLLRTEAVARCKWLALTCQKYINMVIAAGC